MVILIWFISPQSVWFKRWNLQLPWRPSHSITIFGMCQSGVSLQIPATSGNTGNHH